ncbi:MAG: DUF2779 domain-containing protein [Bacilli bacterium]|nr:DUF2779 domain-containing protein [Bacilli bacterium]
MVNISKSLYCNYVQCKKMVWLLKNKMEEYVETKNEQVLDNGNKVGDLARRYFGNYSLVKYDEVLINMIMDTKKLLKDGKEIICEASFKFNNLFASIDVLKIEDDGVSIYEVKSSSEIKDIYKDDASFQAYILKKLGYKIKSVNIMHVNSNYVLGKEFDIKEFFTVEDITDISILKENEIEEYVKEMNEVLDSNKEPNIDIDKQCFSPYPCPFFKYCTKHLPEKNVFDINGKFIRLNDKLKLYHEGNYSYETLINSVTNEKALDQIDFVLNNKKPKINVEKIKEFMSKLKYPLYFLDYETCQFVIPEIEGTRPYQQLTFQYSLHILDKEDGELIHKEFLADVNDKDFIRHFAESLIKDIPGDGSVIIYNKSFEPTRNKEIARMYPEFKEDLEKINSNMIDFMIPFYEHWYYTKEMEGSYSIKYVLPALYRDDPSLDYHNLDLIHNGGEASSSFIDMIDKSEEEVLKIRKALLKYCELDTYAMVKIYEKLKEIE